MHQFNLKISKISVKVNAIFISPVTLMCYFDVALNTCNAGQGSVFCVWLISCNDPMSLAVGKRFLRLNAVHLLRSNVETYLSTLTSAQRIINSLFL